MNLVPLPNRFRRLAKLPEPEELCVHVASQIVRHGIEQLVSREPQTLEVKIGDDFDELPRAAAEDFWTDSLSEQQDGPRDD
jgi:hypothetical protein